MPRVVILQQLLEIQELQDQNKTSLSNIKQVATPKHLFSPDKSIQEYIEFKTNKARKSKVLTTEERESFRNYSFLKPDRKDSNNVNMSYTGASKTQAFKERQLTKNLRNVSLTSSKAAPQQSINKSPILK